MTLGGAVLPACPEDKNLLPLVPAHHPGDDLSQAVGLMVSLPSFRREERPRTNRQCASASRYVRDVALATLILLATSC